MMPQKVLGCYFIAFAVLITAYGVIPFISVAYPGEIVWISGFAQSFINQGWGSLKAVNFGIPAPAPLPFGLASALLQGAIMYSFKLHAWDAYAWAAIFWLFLALLGGAGLAQLLGASSASVPLLSLMYLTLPIIWWHAAFSILSFGFALLPLYLFSAFRLIFQFWDEDRSVQSRAVDVLLFLATGFLSVFIDGYTYVMFFVGTTVVYVTALAQDRILRIRLLVVTLPIIGFTFFASYRAYTSYLGVNQFHHESVDFFRAWGADIVMMLIPSAGVSWLCDSLHLSAPRTDQQFFGDASVWMTTFSAPFLIIGIIGFLKMRRHPFALPSLLVFLCGFYFALGPSLKVNSVRPTTAEKMRPAPPNGRLMPKSLALIPTGSSLFDKDIPGFNSMRATYRWSGLMFVGLYGLAVLLSKGLAEEKRRLIASGLPCVIILLNMPNLPQRLANGIYYRASMEQMASDLNTLDSQIGPGHRVVFYPLGNDFIVNYLAARGRYYTYNTGGDKNLDVASRSWPASVLNFFSAPPDENLDREIAKLLLSGDADAVVLPYFDKLINASEWPPSQTLVAESKRKYASVVAKLSENPKFLTTDSPLYGLVSLRSAKN
jgi:hypothetical protein